MVRLLHNAERLYIIMVQISLFMATQIVMATPSKIDDPLFAGSNGFRIPAAIGRWVGDVRFVPKRR
jgi:hypothetical protein